MSGQLRCSEWSMCELAVLALIEAAHRSQSEARFYSPNCLLVPQGCHRIDAERASAWYQSSQNRNKPE